MYKLSVKIGKDEQRTAELTKDHIGKAITGFLSIADEIHLLKAQDGDWQQVNTYLPNEGKWEKDIE